MAKRLKRLLPLGLAFLLTFLTTIHSWAVDPNKRLSQYSHVSWRTQDGFFPGSPRGIAQTNDGYMWVGTTSGVLRFDGVRFVPWTGNNGEKLPSSQIGFLRGARDGALWIGTTAGLSRWKDHRLTSYPSIREPIGSIIEDDNGGIWFTRQSMPDGSNALCQVLDAVVRCYGKSDGVPPLVAPIPLVADPQGDFWIGSDTTLLRWKHSSSTVYQPSQLRRNAGLIGFTGLAPAHDGTLWVGVGKSGRGLGLQRLAQGRWKAFATPELDGSTLNVMTLFLDRENALWVGTASQGLYRIYGDKVEHFGSADGLSDDTVGLFFEDREGNVWFSTAKGLDRFSDTRVVSFSSREGLGSSEADSVIASHDGGVWISGSGSLDNLREGHVSSIRSGKGLPGNQVTALLEDHTGRLWVGLDNSLSIYQDGAFKAVKKRDGSPIGAVKALAEDVDGSVWAETFAPRRILAHIQDLTVMEEFSAPQVPPASRIVADPRGGIWLGLMDGDLAHYQHGTLTTYRFDHSPGARVYQLLANPDGSVLGATTYGVIGWREGKLVTLSMKDGLPCEAANAMTLADSGDLWLFMDCGLVEIAAAELKKWWEHPDDRVQSKVFDVFDGVQPSWAPFVAGARSTDGRLWFANGTAVQTIDPNHLDENPIPPPVQIEEIVADRKTFSPGTHLRLPPLTRDLEIDYTALSFAVPQKVNFRYKLEGRDKDWQDIGTRRQAFYTDLRPDHYRFRVIACNNNGLWNQDGATIDFSIAPAWFQTRWFWLSCILSGCLLLWTAYGLRVRQIGAAISARFDERLSERTRLARELHDTFLQTIQGSKLVADNALDPTTDCAGMRRAMEQLSIWLARATQEGRAALNSLRTSTTERNDLAEGLREVIPECCKSSPVDGSLSVVGDAQDMHPVIREEIFRIGYEAIRNACTHSNGTRVEVALNYAQDLTLRVRDDGVGIDPATADKGKAGHFGLQGMRERAARIGSKLTVVSSPNSGTEVTLVVPGRIVFRKASQRPIEKIKTRLDGLL